MADPTLQTPEGTETDEGTVITPPIPAPVVPAPVATPVVPEIDYKEKFSSSTRENQRIMGELDNVNKLLGDITKVEIPTDVEMSKMYADWDTFSSFEQDLAKKQIVQEKRLNNIHAGIGRITSTVEKSKQVTDFIKANTSLAGKEDKFLDYALKPEHNGVTLPILLNSFLFENPVVPPVATVPPAPAPSPLQRGTPAGTGTHPTDATTISDDEAEAISKSNPKLYMEMVRDGRIK